MKNTYKVVILLLIIAGVSSCIVKVQYYKHEPTHGFSGIGNQMKCSSFKKLLDFTDNGIVFVPEFSEFTPHYLPAARSYLIFYSQIKTSMYIEKAILYSGSKNHKKELTINKEVQINEKFKSFFEGGIPLFGGIEFLQDETKVADYERIWSEDSAILEVYYRIPKDSEDAQFKKMEFKLELKTSPEIAWST